MQYNKLYLQSETIVTQILEYTYNNKKQILEYTYNNKKQNTHTIKLKALSNLKIYPWNLKLRL
jgi:hypothetical protein